MHGLNAIQGEEPFTLAGSVGSFILEDTFHCPSVAVRLLSMKG